MKFGGMFRAMMQNREDEVDIAFSEYKLELH